MMKSVSPIFTYFCYKINLMSLFNIINLFRLSKEEEEKDTYNEIEEGIHFRGHNLWLLVCAMAIACIGLNVNSQAAVIGAMLISPLMGPVVGLSFGLSIHDKNLIKLSVWNWLIMIVTSLLASTVYFMITPFHSETSQLEAFKEATVFDCMIALFGGLAWFIGITRKEAIKTIAGVAVATACIPPLCTAGFGLANGNWEYFFGGLYYYLVNCVFIGIGTWILSIILGYQRYYLLNSQGKSKQTTLIITVLSILVLTPSIFLTVKKWNKENFRIEADQYIKKIEDKTPEIAIVNYKAFKKGDKKYLDITVLNDSTFLSKNELYEHDMLNKDIELVWHYSKQTTSTSSEIKFLQSQMNDLKQKLKETEQK